MTRSVLLCLPPNSSYKKGLVRAFSYFGLEVKFFDSRSFTFIEKLRLAISNNREWAVNSLNSRLVAECIKTKPNCLFVMKGELLYPKTIQAIGKQGIPTINWFPDHVDALPLATKLSKVYDLFYHFDPHALKELNRKSKKKSYYLPFAADILPSTDFPNRKEKKTYKLVFIGNYNNRREKYLKSVADLGLHIWGDERWASSELKDNYRGYLPNSKLKEVLNKSTIALNIQHDYPSSGAVLRVFEITGSGTPLLSEYRKDIAKLYQEGSEVVLFKTPSELRSKAIYLLSHVNKSNAMAKRAFLATKRKHTYVIRLKQLLKRAALL